MIEPIGTFLTRMDAALTGSMDQLISAMTTFMFIPVTTAAVIYYVVQGVKLANGDPTPLSAFVPNLVRVGMVIYLSSNLTGFNTWVRDIFFTTLPNTLSSVVTDATGGIGAAGAGSSVTGTAAVFGGVWDGIWKIVSTIWSMADLSVMGGVAVISGGLVAATGGAGLAFMAIVYLSSRLVLAVLVCLAPLIIGCGIFDATKGIVERAIGKAISLILMQIACLIILQIILGADQWFIVQANGHAAKEALASSLPDALQVLWAVGVWFIAGAMAMLALPALAYSIGGGIAIPGPSAYSMALMGRGMATLAGALSGGGGGGGGGGAPPPPNISLSLAQSSLSGGGGGQATLPPPPPPAITHSTRRT